MNWTILNVSIPVYDLQKSKQFYDMLIGYNENQKLLYQSLYKNEESIFFGNKGFGLRLFKPIPDLSISNHIQSRRSYITLLVDNLENIKEKLELKDIKFIYKKSDNELFKSLYVCKKNKIDILITPNPNNIPFLKLSCKILGIPLIFEEFNVEFKRVKGFFGKSYFSRILKKVELWT